MSGDRPRLGDRAVKGFFWNYGAIAGGRAFFFVATLVLARELSPQDFGVVAFTLAVLAYLEAVTSHGLGETLVYRKDGNDPALASTVFWLSVATSIVLVLVMWGLADPIASLGPDDESLVLVVQVLSIELLITSFGNTQAYMLRHSMRFDRLFVPQLVGGFVKGATAIVLALAGFGVWSLVIGQLAGSSVRTFGYWSISDWRPSLTFARDRARSLLRKGSGFAVIAVIAGAGRNADYLIIGVTLGTTALGFYYLAFRLPELVIVGPFQAAWQVLFPAYARVSDRESDPAVATEALERGFRDSVRIASMVALPVCTVIAALASPLVLTLYGSPWEPSVAPLALISLWAGIAAVSGMAGVVLKSLGRTGTLTTATTVSTAVRLPVIWFATYGGITAVAFAQLAVQLVWLVGIFVVVARVLDAEVRAILAPIIPAVVVSVVVGAAAWLPTTMLPPAPSLVVGSSLALLVYGFLVHRFCAEVLDLVVGALRRLTPRRRTSVLS